MNDRRGFIAIVAAGLAVVAVAVVWLYVKGADDRASEKTALRNVVVASKVIPEGTVITTANVAEFTQIAQHPANVVPSDAISSPKELEGSLVASHPVGQGVVIVKGNFVAADDPTLLGSSFSDQIGDAAGLQAISIPIDTVHAVSDLIVPGDFVNIIVTISGTAVTEPAVPGEAAPEGSGHTIGFIASKVKVLAFGAETLGGRSAANAGGGGGGGVIATLAGGDGETTSISRGMITFEASPELALRIAAAASGSSLVYLTLLPPDARAMTSPSILDSDLLK